MHRAALVVAALVSLTALASAQNKKPAEKNDGPRPLVCAPLGVAPGVETKLVVRGLRLDNVTEVRFGDVKAEVQIVSKGKTAVPNMQDAAKVGDTQLELKVKLPADFTGGEAAFTVI